MKKHANKAFRRVAALIMSVILLATSLPIAFAAGDYDPTPTFSKDSTLWAWMTDDGGVQVIFPEATPVKTYISDKHIETYYITLYDLGPFTEVHNDPATEEVPSVRIALDAEAQTFSADGTRTMTFTAEKLAENGITLNESNRFSVEVLAQDSTGWVSEPISTIVSDVPRFEADNVNYTALAETQTNMREVIMMEAANNNGVAYVSGSGTAANGANYRQRVGDGDEYWNQGARWADGALDYIADSSTGTNQLTMLGTKAQAGAEDPDTGVDTSAYGFRVNATGDQSFATTWSRQHWDLTGAEEVWYWFDFSQVSVQDLAFELKAQGKRYEEFYWTSYYGIGNGIEYLYGSESDDDYSTVTYSTKGYTGDDGYVLLQTAEGSWERVALENGGVDLSGYKGYIRVPIQFICSTTDTYVEARNDNWGFGGDGLAENVDENEDKAKAQFENNVLLSERVQVDPAGTPISKALLIQYRQLTIDAETGVGQGSVSGGDPNNAAFCLPSETNYPSLEKPYWGASMLAVGSSLKDENGNVAVTQNQQSNPKRAYVQTTGTNTVAKDGDGNPIIVNRETAYKAVEDVVGAGFSYTSMSADSVGHSFYMDSVMTYKSEGEYPEDMVDDPGRPLTDYYNQRTDIQNSILAQIDALISSPDLGDYRAVQYIDELLETARAGYGGTALGSAFLSDAELESVAAAAGSTAWTKYVTARNACIAGGTIIDNDDGTYTYPSNNTAYDLVPDLIRSLEKLPDPSTVASVSDTLESEIVRLWKIYRQLNLTQLDAMSNEEEQKMLEYAALASDAINEELLIGQAMANNAYVAFNTFGNDSAGEEVYRLENDANASAGQGNPISYRFTKGLLGYTSNLYNFHGAVTENDENGSSNDVTTNGIDVNALRFAGSDFAITNNGASGSAGMTVTLDNAFAGEYNIVSVSKNSLDTSDAATMYANNMAAENLGDLANYYTTGDNSSFPLGLVFYVDFSELSKFRLTATISSRADNGTALDYAFNPGASVGDQTFYMMNEASGEWVKVQGNGNASSSIVSYGLTNSAGVDLQLDGYKGYIMLPLWHFKKYIDGTEDNRMLSRDATGLNNIWRVSIGVAPADSASAQTMDGRSFTIDSIGFGYDSSSGAYGDHGHQTFGEQYGIKTFRAEAFEEVVAALEPQASGNAFNLGFREAANAAKAQYDALSAYEQNLPSTQNAYAILNRYLTDIANNNTTDYAPVLSTSTFRNSWFPGLGLSSTSAVADNNTSGQYDLPYPGVKDTNGDGRADTVNYDAYGLTKEMADEIIKVYNTSYSRYTEAEKAELGDVRQQFLNAYNAAMRCYNTLEHILDEGDTFLNELFTEDASTSLFRTMSDIYPAKADADGLGTAGDQKVYAYDKNTPYGTHVTAEGATVDEGYFVTLKDRTALNHISETYRNLTDYYAKYLLAQGDLQVGVDNIPMAVRKLLNNSDTYTNAKGETVYGGIRTLYYRYQDLYNAAKAKVNAGTALSEDELAALRLATEEYEMLLPTYHDVAELYDLIQQIYDLFPAVTSTLTATGSSPSTNQTILLSYDGEAAAVENTIDPVYTLTQFEQYLTDLDGTGTLTMTSQNGGLLKSADGTESLAYEFTYGGQTADFSGGAIEIGSYSAPMSAGIAMHVKISDPQAFPMELSDVVTLTYTYQYTDRFGILREATDVKTVTIRYATDDMYVVEIPAEVEIPWGSDSVKASYVVTCNLNEGSTIDVGITPAAASFDLSANGTAETISCTADSPAAATYSGTQIEATATNPMTISIEAPEWQNIPVAAYRANDQITYTVQYTDGSATP